MVTACEACEDRGWNLRDARIQPCDCGTYDPPKWVRRGDAACVIGHRTDPDRPRRAHVGYACAGHRAKIEQMIAELPALYDDLGIALTSSERHGGHDGKNTRSATTGININERVLEARQEVHNELVRMVRDVEEARGITGPQQWALVGPPPGHEGPANREQLAADTVPAMTMWLLRQLDWLCEQPDVDETHDNLFRLTADCRWLAAPSYRPRLEIGPCGKDDCPGTLWMTGETDEARTMSCDYCARTVEPRYWRRERRRIDGVDVNPWLTLPEAAAQYGTTTRTVERWVAKGRLKARGQPMRVKASAVEALMQGFVNRCA